MNHQFSDDEIASLTVFRDEQTDIRLKVRFIALLLLAEKVDIPTVQRVIGKSEATLKRWFNQYQNKGVRSLNSFQYKPKQTFLDQKQQTALVKWVQEKNPASCKEIQAHIGKLYKISYSVDGVRKLLKKIA